MADPIKHAEDLARRRELRLMRLRRSAIAKERELELSRASYLRMKQDADRMERHNASDRAWRLRQRERLAA
jgi:hypothetical protein